MGAGIGNDKNEVDWIGTESGEPRYPVWSTGCNKPGAGMTVLCALGYRDKAVPHSLPSE